MLSPQSSLRSTAPAPEQEAGRRPEGRRPTFEPGPAPTPARPVQSRLVEAARDAAAADRESLDGATDHLAKLLATIPVIEQAKGVLMGYYGIDAATAFALLRRWSSHSNVKLSRLAEQLLEAAAQPSDRPFAGLQTLLVAGRPALRADASERHPEHGGHRAPGTTPRSPG